MAVHKWENGNSMPDILLLAPIARLLGISLDTLLSFREELTTEEIQRLVYEADKTLEELLFSDYGMVSMVFHNFYMLAMQENNLEKAHMLVKKQRKSEK
jgi:transcriptional regulator with XRE-family HTH domain